jgi:outer membrane protein TolC
MLARFVSGSPRRRCEREEVALEAVARPRINVLIKEQPTELLARAPDLLSARHRRGEDMRVGGTHGGRI